MDSVRSVALGFWFRHGRVHEPAGREGISHMLEHLVFKGSHRRSARDLVAEIERVGGGLDAYTTHEATAFLVHLPSAHLPTAIDVLADMCFHPALRDADLELERGVILEELAEIEESPEDVAFELHARFLYGGHPYGEPIIGSHRSVTALSADALRDLHRRVYVPANLVIAAAGDVDHETLLDLVSRHVPADGTAAAVPDTGPVEGSTGSVRVTREGARQAHIVAGALAVRHDDPLRYAIVVASTALGGGMSSRLFQRIREELGLAYSVYGYHAFFARTGHVGAYVGTGPDSVHQAREALLEELAAFAREGLGDDELEDTRAQIKGQMLMALESPMSRMNRLAGFALYDEAYQTLDAMAARIDAVDRDRCAQACALFDPDRAAVLELTPPG